MEGILTLIIIIIIFNLFNFLARSLKGGPANQKGRVLVEKEEPLTDPPGQINAAREEDEKSYDVFFDMQQNTDHEKDRVKTYPEETAMPVVEETKRKTIEKKGSSPRLSGNLNQLLTKKDPLLTAFIFHEIIDPPRIRRRKL